jgi:hypothetical protein
MSFTQKDYKGNELLILDTVRGFKQWSWNTERKLVSMFPADWSNGSIVSECSRSELNKDKSSATHKSPDQDCSCGVYAHYLPLESYEKQKHSIFGVVEASGKILMGTKGFRAEKARVVALAGYGACNQWFENTEKTRGVYPEDVVDFCTSIGVPYFPTVRQMVYEFPQDDLSTLGVSEEDLLTWKARRDTDKKAYEERVRAQQEFLASQRLQEEELYRRYGVKPGEGSKRFLETFRHLGGFK